MKSKTQSVDDIKHIEDTEDENSSQYRQLDLSLLRIPILTAVTGFLEARKAFEGGTDEIRKLLTNECDLIYECKVCRNIFRSFTNFISHKRVYCRKLFNPSHHFHFENDGFIDQDTATIIQVEHDCKNYQNSKSKKSQEDSINKDLSSIVERLKRKQHTEFKLTDFYDKVNHKLTQDDVSRKEHILQLDQVPDSTAAVYQTLKNNETDNIREEIHEVHSLLFDNKIVLGPDGKIIPAASTTNVEYLAILNSNDSCNGAVSPADSLMDSGIINCAICNAPFKSEKTLKLHLEMKHIPSTYVYPCPSCSQTFLQPALVFRHLSNDHKKSMRKIKLMRESIIKKRTRIDEIVVKGPSRELSKLQSNQERQDAATKAWMENMEHFDKGPMCTFCGKSFDRKAVLTTHMTNCPQKSRGPNKKPTNSSSQKTKDDETMKKNGKNIKIEPETSDENSNSNSCELPLVNAQIVVQSNLHSSLNDTTPEMDEDDKSMIQIKQELALEEELVNKRKRKKTKVSLRNDDDEIYWSEDEEEKPATPKPIVKVEEVVIEVKPKIKRVRAKKIKKEPLEPVEQNKEQKIPCLKCKKEFESDLALKSHTKLFHNRQKRFWCVSCEFRGYRRVDTINHLLTIHNYNGDMENINTMINFKKDIKPKKIVDLKTFSENITSIIESVSRSYTDEDNTESVNNSTILETTNNESTLNNNTTIEIKVEEESSAVVATLSAKRRGRPKLNRTEETPEVVQTGKKTKLTKKTTSTPISNDEDKNAPKRPIRNRIKAVNKDFVYDLSHLLLQKESDLLDYALPELIPIKPIKRKTSLSSIDDIQSATTEKSLPKLSEMEKLPQGRYMISAVKGAAFAMAQAEVSECQACFSKPSNIPHERASIPKSPIKQQDTIPNHDWPVLKKQRKIGSIVKEKNDASRVKRKYIKRIPLLKEEFAAKKGARKIRSNSPGPPMLKPQIDASKKQRKSAPAKHYEIFNKIQQKDNQKDDAILVNCSTPAEFQQLLAINHLAESPVSVTVKQESSSSSSHSSDSAGNGKRLTILQRLAENKNKKQQTSKKAPLKKAVKVNGVGGRERVGTKTKSTTAKRKV